MNDPGYHKRYYLEHNVDDMLLKARNRVEELTIIKTIAEIDAKLRILNTFAKLYPPQNAAVEEPSAVHSAPSS
jgi:hypothetical protein